MADRPTTTPTLPWAAHRQLQYLADASGQKRAELAAKILLAALNRTPTPEAIEAALVDPHDPHADVAAQLAELNHRLAAIGVMVERQAARLDDALAVAGADETRLKSLEGRIEAVMEASERSLEGLRLLATVPAPRTLEAGSEPPMSEGISVPAPVPASPKALRPQGATAQRRSTQGRVPGRLDERSKPAPIRRTGAQELRDALRCSVREVADRWARLLRR